MTDREKFEAAADVLSRARHEEKNRKLMAIAMTLEQICRWIALQERRREELLGRKI